jgi:hypothetical protein
MWHVACLMIYSIPQCGARIHLMRRRSIRVFVSDMSPYAKASTGSSAKSPWFYFKRLYKKIKVVYNKNIGLG